MKKRLYFYWLILVGCLAFFVGNKPETSIPADLAGVDSPSHESLQTTFSTAPQLLKSDGLPSQLQQNETPTTLSGSKDFHSLSDFILSGSNGVISQNNLFCYFSRFVHSSAQYQKCFFAPLVQRYLLFENWRK